MKSIEFDIDIDMKNRDDLLSRVEHVNAAIKRDDGMVKHNTGVYFQTVPQNYIAKHSIYDHKEANELGYMKIDLLNVSMYDDVRDTEHLDELVSREPMWELLLEEDFICHLSHVSNYGNIMRKIKPTSIEELAIVLALIRPSKKYLIDFPFEVIKRDIWKKPSDGSYYFKKSHAISYSLAIVVQMNSIVDKLTILSN